LAQAQILNLDPQHTGRLLKFGQPQFIKLVYEFAASSTGFVAAADAELGPNFTRFLIDKKN